MNGLVASESVSVEGDDKDEAIEAVETQELVHQGLQLPQEHLIMSIMAAVDIETLLYPIEEKSGVDKHVESSLNTDQAFQEGGQFLI